MNENRAVARLSEIVALETGAAPGKARQIRTAAALHDIGKIRIPESILSKPGKLSAREFEIMKTHTILGAELLSAMRGTLGRMAVETALFHHEHWDGNGYWGVPSRFLGDHVNITAICDVFTALVSVRAYKAAWPPKEAMDYIQSKTDTQFSPGLVSVFLPLVRDDGRVAAILGKREGESLWQ